MNQLHEIECYGHKLYTCPNGCNELELEIGKDTHTFMSAIGCPYKYIRCGKCGFGETDKNPKLDLKEAIQDWNQKCKATEGVTPQNNQKHVNRRAKHSSPSLSTRGAIRTSTNQQKPLEGSP